MLPDLVRGSQGVPKIPDGGQSAPDLFRKLSFTTWEEAKLGASLKYLRGNRHLNLPSEWLNAMPPALEILHQLGKCKRSQTESEARA